MIFNIIIIISLIRDMQTLSEKYYYYFFLNNYFLMDYLGLVFANSIQTSYTGIHW